MKKDITIADVAKQAGVSKTTVSFYLNQKSGHIAQETKDRIAKAIFDLNYIPPVAQSQLSSGNPSVQRPIGIMLRSITNKFSSQFIEGVQSVLKENYLCVAFESNYDNKREKNFIKEMSSPASPFAGYIIQPTEELEIEWKASNNRNVVMIDNKFKTSKGCWVTCDFYGAVHDTLNMMIERGYEQFVIISAHPENITSREDRIRGLTDNLEHLEKPYTTILAKNTVSIGEFTTKLNKFIKYKIPTCIFVCNDWLLPTVFTSLIPYKKYIPQKLGLIGLNNEEWTELTTPSISALYQPAFEEGEIAARILLDQINKSNQVIPTRILKFTFHEHESTLRKNFLI